MKQDRKLLSKEEWETDYVKKIAKEQLNNLKGYKCSDIIMLRTRVGQARRLCKYVLKH
jgi:hypothetical protein